MSRRPEPVTFVCWKWKPRLGYRSHFGAEQVNVLAAMLARHYHAPHRVVCVTDDPKGIDSAIDVVKLWPDHASVPSPHGGLNPSCYRRLKIFSRDAARILGGSRLVSLDLDCVIVDDVTPLFVDDVEFRIWGDTARGTPYNGGLFQLRAGTRAQVWERFDPHTSPHEGRARGYIGSDQAWIAVALGKNEPKWSRADGVYSFRNEILPPRGKGVLPKGARIVMFHGRWDPWHPQIQKGYPWVRENWR